MTYKRLKAIASALLTQDVPLPNDSEQLLGILEMAFDEVSTHASSLHLLTLNRDNDINRIGPGEYMFRYPELPSSDDDEIDLDNELCFPVSRLMASYVSEKKAGVHFMEAKRLIKNYNSKVYEILETMKEQEDKTYDVKPTNYSEQQL